MEVIRVSKQNVHVPEHLKESVSTNTIQHYKGVTQFIESVIEKGPIQSKKDKKYYWKGLPLVSQLYFKYLYKKYNINCSMDYYKLMQQAKSSLKLDMAIAGFNTFVINSETISGVSKQYNKFIDIFTEEVSKCIEKGNKEVIPIDVTINVNGIFHANLLIFNKNTNSVYHFEPYGKTYYGNTNHDINVKIRKVFEGFINNVNKKISQMYKHKSDLKYIPPTHTCPEIEGIQQIEENIKTMKQKTEGNGYCALWVTLIAELVLLNPSMTPDMITTELLSKTKNKEFMAKILLNIARGYSEVVSKKINKYFEVIMNTNIEIKSIDEMLKDKHEKTKFYTLLKMIEIYLKSDNYVSLLQDKGLNYNESITRALNETRQLLKEASDSVVKNEYMRTIYVLERMKSFRILSKSKSMSTSKSLSIHSSKASKSMQQHLEHIEKSITSQKVDIPEHNEESEYMKTVRQTDIKIIQKPETRKRCPRGYRKHPTNKSHCFRERNKKFKTIKKSKYGTIVLKNKKPYTLRYGQRRCPRGYRRNPKNKSECRWYKDWN
jgi:histone H3/H4